MTRGINKCIFIGNLGFDPEVTDTGSVKVANFNIACNEEWKDRESGEKKERVEWVRCVAFAGLAEVAENYLKKGSKIYADGRQQTRSYEDKEGVTRYVTEIVLQTLVMLDGRGEGNSQKASQQAEASGYKKEGKTDHAKEAAADKEDFDDDIPF